MIRIKDLTLATLLLIGWGVSAQSEDRMFEDFENGPATRWEFIADTVMGGVSTGTVSFRTEGQTSFARMIGSVSTENRGGFMSSLVLNPGRCVRISADDHCTGGIYATAGHSDGNGYFD